MDKEKQKYPPSKNKQRISQKDLQKNVKTFEENPASHAALKTPEGKNNGAKPAAYDGQQSNHP
jgi:hypothetical protein